MQKFDCRCIATCYSVRKGSDILKRNEWKVIMTIQFKVAMI